MEMISMSVKEVSRLDWLLQVKLGEMSLSYRQAKRIWKRYSASGASRLVHGLRGKPSNRKTDESLRMRVLQFCEEKYFGCRLAVKYLHAEDKKSTPVETLRQWLKQAGNYQRRRKSRAHRSWRPRLERSGELVQLDDSLHAWFGDRGTKAC